MQHILNLSLYWSPKTRPKKGQPNLKDYRPTTPHQIDSVHSGLLKCYSTGLLLVKLLLILKKGKCNFEIVFWLTPPKWQLRGNVSVSLESCHTGQSECFRKNSIKQSSFEKLNFECLKVKIVYVYCCLLKTLVVCFILKYLKKKTQLTHS